MARIDPITPPTEIGDMEALEKDLSEAAKATAALEAPAAEEQSHVPNELGEHGDDTRVATNVPQKYAGKSTAQVIEMHQNLESAFGRQANDLGTQRKLTDRLLDLKRTDDLSANTDPLPEVTPESLLDNPSDTLDKYLDVREQRVAAKTEQRIHEMEQALAQTSFKTKHPDYEALAKDEAFAVWVRQSPMRSQYAGLAAQGNWQAMDSLLDDYKRERPRTARAATPVNKTLAAARQAGLTRTGTARSAANRGKTVYRRADLMQLQIDKPESYRDPQFQEEIRAAYAEGRVV